ncbi:MAG: response regulator [Leptolyngbya sp. SIOISBB]|nr:response regulator [Leptolyngbya sp. SIOISBB]
MKILLVEDDQIFAEQLSIDLIRHNYLVEVVPDAESGWEYAHATNYDLIVLDVQLPDSDGISLCQKLRQAHYESAILLLTANSDSADKVKGLDAGADDYVVKPCTSEELCARIRALLRRPRAVAVTVLQCGGLRLDPSTCDVAYLDKKITLSPKEYVLLELFLRNPHRVFSSGVLLEKLWSFEETPGEETIRTHIKRLRRKLKQAGAHQVIENVYGMGYRLNSSLAAEYDQTADSRKPPRVPKAVTDATPKTTSAALQSAARGTALSVISRFRPEFLERLTALDQFSAGLTLGDRSEQLQQQARHAVHKLIGSLGMFGLVDASQHCQAIDAILQTPAEEIDPANLRQLVMQLHQQLDPILAVPSSTASKTPSPSAATRLTTAAPPTLMLITNEPDDFAELQAIAPLATVQPIQVHHQLLEQEPNLLLLDMAAFVEPSHGLTLLTTLVSQFPNLPIVVLGGTDTFQLRLAVARCGGMCTYLLRTLPPSELWDSLSSWYYQHGTIKPHILAVDDDPVILETLSHQLAANGFQVTTLQEPGRLWESLALVRPDLLLLDFEMPEINGIELCRIIRADKHWQHLPIVFLSGQQDLELIQKIYQAGADDYISKPITQPELIIRILNRVRRSQQMLT